MANTLFDLDFGRWDIIALYLIPSCINLGIFIYISFFSPANRTNFAFSIFVLLTGFWQLGETLMRLSTSAEIAHEWFRISGLFSLFVIPFGIRFTLNFSRKYNELSNSLFFVVFILPSIICLAMVSARLDSYTVLQSESSYWTANPEPTPVTTIVYLLTSLEAVLMLGMLWVGYVKEKKDLIRSKQLLTLALGFTIPVIGGIILEAVFPLVLGWDVVPVITPLLTIFSIAALITIKKYRLLDYSPKHQWDRIVEAMSEGMVIINNRDEIMYANKVFCKLLGYEFSEINGKVANKLFFDEAKSQSLIKSAIEKKGDKTSGQYEIQLKAKSGKRIWVSISGSPYIDDNENVIGTIGLLRNVTERKKMEEALEENQIYLRTIIDAEPECIKLLDKDGRLLDMNPAGIALLEADNLEQLKGQSVLGLIDEPYKKAFSRLIQNVFQGKSELMEFEITGLKGARRWMETHSVPLRNAEGEIISLLGLTRDITEKKKAEEKLKQSESGLKEAQAIANLGNWKMNLATGIGLWSEEACRIYGIPPEENEQTYATWVSYIHPDDLDSVMDVTNSSRETLSDTVLNHRIILKDGTIKHIHAKTKFEFGQNGEPIGLYGITHDVTDKVIAGQAIKESNERYELATKATNEVLWDWDIVNDKIYRSENYEEQFGYTPSSDNVYDESWIQNVHAEDKERALESMLDKLNNTVDPVWECEYRFYKNNKELTYIRDKGHIVRDEEGIALRMVGAMMDITRRKESELQLHDLLGVTNEQNSRLQNFAYIVSHNIRSHSANLTGLVDVFWKSRNDEELTKFFKMMKKSTDKLGETIENLNEIITIQTDTSKKMKEVDLRLEVDRTCDVINTLIAQTNTKIVNNIRENTLINAVPSYMESILLNLISNGIKYRSPLREPVIVISVKQEDKYLVLSISDNGIGIDLEKNGDKLFGMYKTFHNNENARGIGLFITKNQIEVMNGKIEVESELGVGSKFKIYFYNGKG